MSEATRPSAARCAGGGESTESAASGPPTNRRESDRVPFPAEMVLVWNYDLVTTLRYRVLDAGDGGYRIHSSVPVLEGTTGMVLRLLPGRGQQMDQPVMVAWARSAAGGPTAIGGYDIGLRCF